MDIRSFFGGKPAKDNAKPVEKKAGKKRGATAAKKRTALTDEAERSLTPPPKRPRTATVQKKVPIVDVESDVDSDPEEPMNSKYRKNKAAQRIVSSGNRLNLID
jgi:hypothetical protein